MLLVHQLSNLRVNLLTLSHGARYAFPNTILEKELP